MLAELVQYAKARNLDTEAGFRSKTLRWVLLFKPKGQFVGVLPQGGDGKKGREVAKCPHLQFAGDTPMRQFLVDTAEYLALFSDEPDDAKLLKKHNYALSLIEKAGEAVQELAVIGRSLRQPATIQAIREALAQLKAKSSDNVTPAIQRGESVHVFVDSDEWHDWWRGYWPTLFEERKPANGELVRCMVSGELCQPALTHPKIRNLGDVGGKVETALVAFNQDSFCSYGLEQSANSAMGEAVAAAYAGALNDLIQRTGQRIGGTKIVHWYAGRDGRGVVSELDCDPIMMIELPAGLFESPKADATPKRAKKSDAAEEERAGELDAFRRGKEFLASVVTGKRADLADYRYFALTLSGASARVMVRNFVVGQFGELCKHVHEWFEHLQIVHRSGEGLAPPPKFGAVLAAMVRGLDDVPPPSAAKLWRCAALGEAIPDAFAAQAVSRAAMSVIANEVPNHARMGLLRAYLIRKGDTQMDTHVNEDHRSAAYHCGRLLAVLADIQYAALGDVGAGIVQRYYAAASATPALVLGRLVRLTNTGHLPRVEPVQLRRWHENRLAGVWAKVRQDPPAVLSLEEQTLFAMGYYQQKADRSRPKPNETEAETTAA